MKCAEFEGTVFTGEGNGIKYLSLPWVRTQLEEKLGYAPFLGTLNLRLTDKSVRRRKSLRKAKPIVIFPVEGYCIGLLFKGFTRDTECGVIIPQIKGYPDDLLEVIAAVNLRETLKLKDGEVLTVSVQV